MRADGHGKQRTRGATMLEVALTVSVTGTLLAILVPSFLERLRLSKTAEAAANLAELHGRTAAYFDASHDESGVSRAWCLPEAAGPTPRHPSARPILYDFQSDTAPGHETWRALGFTPGRVRYRYSVVPEATGCGLRRAPHAPVVTFRAEGDLDEDGVLSSFERQAAIDQDGRLEPVSGLWVHRAVE